MSRLIQKLQMIPLITAVIVSLVALTVVIAVDFGSFIIPRDDDKVLATDLTFAGADYVVIKDTNVVSLYSKDSDTDTFTTGETNLIYSIWILGDGTGTDWAKVTVSTYTGGITTSTVVTQAVSNSSTAITTIDLPVPAKASDAYFCVNDTNTIGGLLFR